MELHTKLKDYKFISFFKSTFQAKGKKPDQMQNNPSLLFVQNKLFCPVPKLFGIKKRGESLRFRV